MSPELIGILSVGAGLAALFVIPLYKAFIGAGASEESASHAAEDVVQLSQLEHLATKTDIANLETRLVKWMVGSLFFFAGIVIAGVSIVIQIMLSPGVSLRRGNDESSPLCQFWQWRSNITMSDGFAGRTQGNLMFF